MDLRLVAMGGLGVLLAACGQSTPGSVSTSVQTVSSPTVAVNVTFTPGTVDRVERSDPGIGAILAPPALGANPVVTADEAFAVYERDMPHAKWDSITPKVLLTDYSNSVYGHSSGADGKINPKFDHVLSWAIIYNNVTELSAGAAPKSTSSTSTPETYITDFVYLVDANSGDYMMAFDETPGTFG